MSESAGGLSRRSALKRIGAGAAVVWSAPAIVSFGSAAARAAGSGRCDSGIDWACFDDIQECGTGAGQFPLCVCDVDQDGNPFCWNDFLCSAVSACTSNADCPAGWACVTTCCDGDTCAPPCGTSAQATTNSRVATATGPTGSGR